MSATETRYCTCHYPTPEAREYGSRTYVNPDCDFHGEGQNTPLRNRIAALAPDVQRRLEFARYLHGSGKR